MMEKKRNNTRENASRYRKMGLQIAYYRKLNNLTQEQLAEMLNVSPGYISQVESQSKTQPISMDLLFNIADVLEIQPKQLLDFEK